MSSRTSLGLNSERAAIRKRNVVISTRLDLIRLWKGGCQSDLTRITSCHACVLSSIVGSRNALAALDRPAKNRDGRGTDILCHQKHQKYSYRQLISFYGL
jgi:hypothetical protein